MPADLEHRDVLINGRARGRGAQLNPGNRFDRVRLHVLGEVLDEAVRERPQGSQIGTQIFDDATRRIINRVDSPDIGFKWTINPYRGCEQGCAYCYARPTHETLGFSCGLDFETKIMVKRDAPELLRRELAAARWTGEPIVMSGVTDPYQPIERELRITRRCLEVMDDCRQPVSIVTKNRLVTRDIDLLHGLACHNAVRVAISLTTLDGPLSSSMEPRASSPIDRLRAIRELTDARIPVTVMTAPIIPGVNDREIPALLEAAKDAGASAAGWVMLRLPHQLKDVFLDWLRRELPDRATRVERTVRAMRGGELYQSTWRVRQRGEGPLAEQIGRTFDVFARRLGLAEQRHGLNSAAFRPPQLNGQLPLFDG